MKTRKAISRKNDQTGFQLDYLVDSRGKSEVEMFPVTPFDGVVIRIGEGLPASASPHL